LGVYVSYLKRNEFHSTTIQPNLQADLSYWLVFATHPLPSASQRLIPSPSLGWYSGLPDAGKTPQTPAPESKSNNHIHHV
jgi:hypothetical protein